MIRFSTVMIKYRHVRAYAQYPFALLFKVITALYKVPHGKGLDNLLATRPE